MKTFSLVFLSLSIAVAIVAVAQGPPNQAPHKHQGAAIRLPVQRSPRAALCPIICPGKRAGTSRKKPCPQCQGELRKLIPPEHSARSSA
jgi:hypothetical protein